MLSSTIMNQKRRAKLFQLPDFQNIVDPWEVHYEELRKFLKEHENRYPDVESSDENEIRLAKWFQSQVQCYRQWQGLQQCEDICSSIFGGHEKEKK